MTLYCVQLKYKWYINGYMGKDLSAQSVSLALLCSVSNLMHIISDVKYSPISIGCTLEAKLLGLNLQRPEQRKECQQHAHDTIGPYTK